MTHEAAIRAILYRVQHASVGKRRATKRKNLSIGKTSALLPNGSEIITARSTGRLAMNHVSMYLGNIIARVKPRRPRFFLPSRIIITNTFSNIISASRATRLTAKRIL